MILTRATSKRIHLHDPDRWSLKTQFFTPPPQKKKNTQSFIEKEKNEKEKRAKHA